MSPRLAHLFVIIVALLPIQASAQESLVVPCQQSACFHEKHLAGTEQVHFQNSVRYEFLKLDLYTAALYLPTSIKKTQDVLGDVPKALELYYHKKVPVKWMTKAAKKVIKKNPENDYESLESRVEKIGEAYQKVGKGERYRLMYDAENDLTSLYHNDEFVVSVPGEDFQRAYFGIWLSEYPINKKYRDRLIFGESKEAS